MVEKKGTDADPTPLLQDCAKQLQEYFQGTRDTFHVPTAPEGTAFQRAVWNALKKIPAGKHVTYGDLAKKIGLPGAARAVGNALNKNPLLVIVPCHRVLASNGLGGFACGLDAKKWMLQREHQELAYTK